MPSVSRESMGIFCDLYADELTFSQALLFGLWTLCILVRRFADTAASVLKRRLLASLETDKFGGRDDPVPGDAPSGFAESPLSVAAISSDGSLMPPLPDGIVRDRIWVALMSPPSVLLLLRLRHVSTSWSRFVATTIEWNAWVFVRLDSLGYCRYTVTGGLPCRPFSLRFCNEVENYRLLIFESMEEMASRVRFFRLRNGSFPSYVFPDGCPPDVDLCPEYYDL